LAIAWGNAIQLVVYNNQKEVNKGLENPSLQLDGFYICECESIDSVFFLSESLIFIVVNKKMLRFCILKILLLAFLMSSLVPKH